MKALAGEEEFPRVGDLVTHPAFASVSAVLALRTSCNKTRPKRKAGHPTPDQVPNPGELLFPSQSFHGCCSRNRCGGCQFRCRSISAWGFHFHSLCSLARLLTVLCLPIT